VDPNYREDSDDPTKGGLSKKSKPNRKAIKPETTVSIALGGHRYQHHRK
jgi:hypothetical protein